jgi:hypothetical protein
MERLSRLIQRLAHSLFIRRTARRSIPAISAAAVAEKTFAGFRVWLEVAELEIE